MTNQNTTDENPNSIRQMVVGEDGTLKETFLPDMPLEMVCEFKNCKNTNGKDYKRNSNEIEKGWEEEPIFLCVQHSSGHDPIDN